ncbi:MAG: ribonuclease III [Candidatus Eisenbacteria bacterium]
MGRPAKPRRERGGRERERERETSNSQQEARVLAEFCKHFKVPFRDMGLLKLALTHRSYLSVTGQGPRESNERLEFLGDSVLGLVTSEALYRRHPDEHEGQLTKTKSLLVSKAILSRRALKMGLGRFVLMSHSEVESGGRQRLSILADAFESVLGAIYLDQGFEVSRQFIHTHLLSESDAIVADKRHTNYKSHLQEYVQSTFRTHPVYRIRSEYGPDHSKHFMVEVMVGKRTLGDGRGHNKKEAEQAAARDALEKVSRVLTSARGDAAHEDDEDDILPEPRGIGAPGESAEGEGRNRRRGRRGGRGRRMGSEAGTTSPSSRPLPEHGGLSHAAQDEVRLEAFEPGSALAGDAASRSKRLLEDGYGDEDEDLEEIDDSGVIDDEAVDEVEDQDDEPDDDADDDSGTEYDDDTDDETEDEVEVDPDNAPPAERPAREVMPAPDASVRSAIPAAPTAPVTYGRGGRRGSGRRPGAPVPISAVGPLETVLPVPPHEELRLDVFGHDDVLEAPPPAQAEPTPPPTVVPASKREEDPQAQARIEEMERAMENFGRRRSGGTGRGGRRR